MAFRFVHTGDLHLDSPFVGLTTEAPANVVETLRESTITAWRNIIDLALDEQADFLLVAGDAFEHANRTLRGQLVFRDGLKRLVGRRASPASSSPATTTRSTAGSPAWPGRSSPTASRPTRSPRSPVIRDDEEIARIYGISYHQRDIKTRTWPSASNATPTRPSPSACCMPTSAASRATPTTPPAR